MIKHMVVAAITLLCACTQRENVNNESSVMSKCTQSANSNTTKFAGCVKVQLDIDRDGVPQNIKVTKLLLGNGADEEIIKAVSKWRYERDKPRNGLVVTIIFVEQLKSREMGH